MYNFLLFIHYSSNTIIHFLRNLLLEISKHENYISTILAVVVVEVVVVVVVVLVVLVVVAVVEVVVVVV